MASVTNVNNMNIPELTLKCFIFIVRSTWHIHRKNISEKKICESNFCGLKAYKLLMKERQFGMSTVVVAKGKFMNGGKEKETGRAEFLTMGVFCGRGPLTLRLPD